MLVLRPKFLIAAISFAIMLTAGLADSKRLLYEDRKYRWGVQQELDGPAARSPGGPLYDKLQAGDYVSVIRAIEAKGDLASLGADDVYYLCAAYRRVKYVENFLRCRVRFIELAESGERFFSRVPGLAKAKILQRTAYLYLEMGQYERAIDEEGESNNSLEDDIKHNRHRIREIRNTQEYLAGDHYVLARAHALLGDKRTARDHIAWFEGYKSPVEGMTESWKLKVAELLLLVGDYESAAESLQGAAHRFDALTGIGKIYEDFMRGDVAFFTENHSNALNFYESLLSQANLNQVSAIHWRVLHRLAAIARKAGNRVTAVEYLKRSIAVIERERATISNDLTKIGYVTDKQDAYRDIVSALIEEGRPGEAFDYAERAKSRALVDLLAAKREFRGGGASANRVAALLDDLNEAEIKIAYADKPNSQRVRGIPVKILRRIEDASPQLASLVAVAPPGTSEIQKLLPPGETLVEYYGDANAFYAFVVSDQGVRSVRLDGSELKWIVSSFRLAISDQRTTVYRITGRTLYERLIKPIVHLIGGGNLTIVPHGPLHYLPFAALPMGEGHLIDRYNIRILPSASVLKFLKSRKSGQPGELLALGNPDLGDAKLDLPAAEAEAVAVAEGRPKSKVLLRGQATETVVKQAGGGFRYLHFASHGTFDPAAPLSSALLLAKDATNDGRLTVAELYDLNLNADLVTLSACETGLGKVASGDDVVGFTRGFLFAGASSIVSTLWQVDDEATARLMRAFYRGLGVADKRMALRTAQLQIKDGYNVHPYFWAAFQLTGAVN